MPEHLPDPAAQPSLQATAQPAKDLPSLAADVTYRGYLALDHLQRVASVQRLQRMCHSSHRCTGMGESSRDGKTRGDRRVIGV